MEVAFDIETTLIAPQGSYLDPTEARVAEVAFWSEGLAEVFSLRGTDGPPDAAERAILVETARLVGDLGAVTLVGWNSSGFDLPFLAVRYAACGIPDLAPAIVDTGLEGKYGGNRYDATWFDADHHDAWYDWQEFAAENGISSGLKPVARFVGLDPIEIDASYIDMYSPEQIREYVLSDVRCTYELYHRLLQKTS